MKKLLVLSHACVVDVNRAVFHELAKAADLEIIMVVPKSWKGSLHKFHAYGEIDDDKLFKKVLPISVNFSGNGSLYYYSKSVKKELQNWSPDLIFLDEEPWSLSALQIARQFKGTPITFFTKQNLKKKIPFPFTKIQSYVFKHSTYAFSVASEVTEVLRDWKGYQKEIKYLPHSYDPKIFKKPSPQLKKELRAKFNLESSEFIVGYLGRLSEEKGLDDLVESIKILDQQNLEKTVNFLFVGNGVLKDRLAKANEVLKSCKITVIPAVAHNQVGEILATFDLLALPSRTVSNWKEQFGRVLVEALGCAVPLIGSDSGEIPHLIKRTGGGESFPEQNIEKLYELLKLFIEDSELYNRYSCDGHDYVLKNLTHQAVAKKLASEIFGF